ncbi:Asp-tRNA(Asn)/Glu-tRNA(Gln) amidotransferase A subunit family amidase [Mycobacterium frederiksbergense]|uniref:amidase n=1 Tax=Mycolicibacterium frederiksbergense TaxID=117567 RepID=A0ABT6KY69_9MYCO|nr:amidase [Mycolicibacterium frederiksbergense]MDH6195653.1 Asp-tRNA(Asn)/Glu-tRNA(Gln) amidotransferase A subunit family amidase [Mycolicibacterium frederiksbergense]
MEFTTDLPAMTATETSRAVRARHLSPVEVIRAAIDVIERRNPTLNAVTYKGYDDALCHARKLEAALMRGEDIGLLAGVPTLMKDLFGHKPGWPATLGSLSALTDNLASEWSTFPARIEAAGGIVIGQTNSPAFGFRGTTDNKTFGPTRNPFDLSRNAGGSSGGSAAAVADGLVPLAGATDGGGSIRIPASWSGVVGFQPSVGRVPFLNRPNAFGPGFFLYEGPITRTVADCALAMTALQGYHPGDPGSLREQVDFLGAMAAGVRGKRIGFTPDYGIFPVDTCVAEVVAHSAAVFESLGASVHPVKLDIPFDQSELSDMWCRGTAIGIHQSMNQLAARGIDLRTACPDELPSAMMRWVDLVPHLTIDDLPRDHAMRTTVFDRFRAAFDNLDFIVAPTVACLPVTNSADGETQGPRDINGTAVDPLIGWCMTYFTNFTGNPSASVPAGLSNGLPVGMLVMGRPHDDAGVMAAIAAFEQAQPWSGIYALTAGRDL